jgi:hypothetical protein
MPLTFDIAADSAAPLAASVPAATVELRGVAGDDRPAFGNSPTAASSAAPASVARLATQRPHDLPRQALAASAEPLVLRSPKPGPGPEPVTSATTPAGSQSALVAVSRAAVPSAPAAPSGLEFPLPMAAVQRDGEAGAGAAGGEAGGAGAAAPTGASGQLDDRAVEDLLRRLYPRLRMQLSRELLVARERAGLLTDLH